MVSGQMILMVIVTVMMVMMGCMMMRRRCMLIGIRAKVTHGLVASCWTRNDAAGDDEDDIYILMKCLFVCVSQKNDHFRERSVCLFICYVCLFVFYVLSSLP